LRIATAILVLLFGCALSGQVRADARDELIAGRDHYKAGRYEEAVKVFHKLLTAAPKPGDKKQREIYQAARPVYAASLVLLGREVDANRVILQHLRADPDFRLTPGQFPPPVVARFKSVREEHSVLLDRIKQQRILDQQRAREAHDKYIKELEVMAAEVEAIETRSRLVALVPFGVGQFQNGSEGWGWFFAVGETLALAGTITAGVVANDLGHVNCRQPDPETGKPLDCAALEQQFLTAQVVNWASFGTGLALMVVGIIEAQVAFKPKTVTKRKRPIPPRPKVEPCLVASPNGVFAGVNVRY